MGWGGVGGDPFQLSGISVNKSGIQARGGGGVCVKPHQGARLVGQP